jgi:sugar O-acyltransferase (sialic acid O-acetyltransferase NeuD family)
MKDLIILGAGGEALEIVQVVRLINKVNKQWNIIGFLDDNLSIVGQEFHGIEVLGTLLDYEKFPNSYFISSIGHPDRPSLREEVRKKIPLDYSKFATIIHPSAVICETVKIGYGCFIQSNCTISTNSIIGNNVLISNGSTIGHESKIDDGTVIGLGVKITSDVIIGKSVYVGPGAIFTNEITIGNNVLIGIGAIVTENVPVDTKYMCHIRVFKLPLDSKNPYTYE